MNGRYRRASATGKTQRGTRSPWTSAWLPTAAACRRCAHAPRDALCTCPATATAHARTHQCTHTHMNTHAHTNAHTHTRTRTHSHGPYMVLYVGLCM
jgi:hypothetical protein